MKQVICSLIFFILIYFFTGCISVTEITIYEKSFEFKEAFNKNQLLLSVPPSSKVDTILIDAELKKIDIFFNKDLSFIPFRMETVKGIYSAVKNFYGENFEDYNYSIITLSKPIEDLIPNYYRDNIAGYDKSRLPIIK